MDLADRLTRAFGVERGVLLSGRSQCVRSKKNGGFGFPKANFMGKYDAIQMLQLDFPSESLIFKIVNRC